MARLTGFEGGHRQDESREQRVESTDQHSAGRHVRRFEHGRHEAAVETLRVRRQGGGLKVRNTETLPNHLVLNSYRLDSYNKMFVEIREILGTKKYMNQESVINAVSKTKGEGKGGKGKKGGKSDSKSQIKIKFAGECWVCGRAGHKQSECWYNPNPKSKAKAAAKSNTVDKSVKCEHCGIKGHKRSECRKIKAEQLAMARSTPSSSTSAADGELTAKKRKRDIAALEKQLAELKLGEPHVEIGAVTTNSKLISVGIDSGAEITVWPPELAPETPTEESDESRLGAKYFGPGDKRSDTRQPRS